MRFQQASDTTIWQEMNFSAERAAQAKARMDAFRTAHETKVLTILFTDVEGSTELQHELGNIKGRKIDEDLASVFRNTLEGVDGSEVEKEGDSFLAVFASPSDGVWFALKLQAAMRRARSQNQSLPQVRVGLHQGEVVAGFGGGDAVPTDIYGAQVSTAARIMKLGCGGQILCSRGVLDDSQLNLKNKTVPDMSELQWLRHGSYKLKGVSAPLEIGEVGERERAPFKSPTGRIVNRTPVYASVIGLIVVIGVSAWVVVRGPSIVINDLRPKVDELDQSTKEILNEDKKISTTVQGVKQATDQIEQNTDRTLKTLDTVAAGVESLTRQGGLVPNASTPTEIYHNAQIYQLNGDAQSARKAFEAFLDFKLEYIDPHLAYMKILKAQEGLEGARGAYRLKQTQWESVSMRLALITLEERKQQLAALDEFMLTHPDFGPVYAIAADEYTPEAVGQQTIEDKSRERKYLDALFDAKEKGNFLKYFLDKRVADQMLERASARRKALDDVTDAVLAKPVTVRFEFYGDNCAAIMIPADYMITKEILYRLGENGEFTSTGFLPVVDPITGRKLPTVQVELGQVKDNARLYVKYIDTRDESHGPYDFVINLQELREKQADMKFEVFNSMPGIWAFFNVVEGQLVVDFSGCFLERPVTILYSLDDNSLSKSLILESDSTNAQVVLPETTKAVHAKIKTSNGKETKEFVFEVKDEVKQSLKEWLAK